VKAKKEGALKCSDLNPFLLFARLVAQVCDLSEVFSIPLQCYFWLTHLLPFLPPVILINQII